MNYISHRGNISGRNPKKENHPDYIKAAINEGYEVEVDIWYNNNQYCLGHNKPLYPIKKEFLRKYSCSTLLHCKDIKTYKTFYNNSIGNSFFFSDKDAITVLLENFCDIRGSSLIQCFTSSVLLDYSICMMPEESGWYFNRQYSSPSNEKRAIKKALSVCAAVCTDNINYYKGLLR